MKQDTIWSLVGSAAAVAASVMARKSVDKAYRRQVGKAPPANPDQPEVGWRYALLWGAGTGMLVGMARVVGRRAGREVLRQTPASRRGQRARRLLGR